MLDIAQARPEEWSAALALAFSHRPPVDQHREVLNALSYLASGEMDPRGLWVARAGGAVVGAQVCIPLGGTCCLYWVPAVRAEFAQEDLAGQLVAAGRRWSLAQGHKIGQLILPLHEFARAEPFLRHGFRLITKLEYLHHDLQTLPTIAAPLPPLRFEPFTEARQPLFERVLLNTYHESLDVPELNGTRTAEEILAGHRAAGRVRPELWWLVHAGATPAGVVLLTELHDGLEWDLSYLGVVPGQRRRGLGRAMTLQALAIARRNAVVRLLVSVDLRNEPARLMYTGLGFRSGEARLVYLAFSPGQTSATGLGSCSDEGPPAAGGC